MFGTALALIKTMRPKHWVKNLVVFAALLFSKSFLDLTKDLNSLIIFLLFCLLAGSVYIVNDIVDIEADKLHPLKSRRPIASGKLGTWTAGISAGFFSLISISAGFYIHLHLGLVLLVYLASNFLYTFWLKEVVILDVLVISFGFVLRAIAGAIAIGVRISPWLIITTTFLALFLALNKRKAEIKEGGGGAGETRESLEIYTASYIDQLVVVATTSVIVSYSMYSFFSIHSDQMLWTTVFVIYGVFRYMFLVETKEEGGQLSDVLLEDIPLIVNILLWLGAVAGILVYFSQGYY
ncbi:MAG: decaprenyl-phosphate phosphoribosyltransferase [Candidatus Bipolaricaulota bacterium]